MDTLHRAAVAGCAALTAALGLLIGGAPASATPTPTPTVGVPTVSPAPTPLPLDTAQAQKAAADATVTAVAGQITAAQARLATAQGAAEAAEQQYTLQMEQREQAIAAQAAADGRRATAQAAVDSRHQQIVSMVVDAYESGDNMPGSSVAALLSAPNLETMLSQAGLKLQLGAQQAEVLAQYEVSLDSLTLAEDETRSALQRQNDAAAAARIALLAAHAASVQAQTEQAALDAALTAARTLQAQAAVSLAVAQATALAVAAAQTLASSVNLNVQYGPQASAAAGLPMAPNAGHWTAEMGVSAANRALQWLGTPYTWAGGGIAGPSRGYAADADSANDGSIIGFDCSGLSMYGWGTYLRMPHNAAAQYASAGALHPAVTELLPGDLVFWSPGGGAAQISHVAVYIGGGSVVQAPQSGDVVKVTPLSSVESGYLGATRPLS